MRQKVCRSFPLICFDSPSTPTHMDWCAHYPTIENPYVKCKLDDFTYVELIGMWCAIASIQKG
jgi:hypothetical protein